jgi:hypothetical protein
MVVYNEPMTNKQKALLKLLGLTLGLTRSTKQPYRFKLITGLLTAKSLKDSDEIIVTSRGLKLIQASQHKGLLAMFAPITDDERETLCALLCVILPKTFHEEKHYDSSLSLSSQVRVHYIKTEA